MTISLSKPKNRNTFVLIGIVFTIVGRVVLSRLLFISIAFYLLAMLKGTDYENFETGILLIPCIRLFDVMGVSFFVNLLLFFPIIVSVIRKRKIDKQAFADTVTLCFIELLHCLTLGNINSVFSNLSAISTLYFCEILLHKKEKYDPVYIFRWLSYGTILSAVTFLLASRKSQSILFYINRGVRFQAFANDPNYYSMYICIALSCLFVGKLSEKNDIVIAVVDIILGLLTSSKMSVIMMAFIIVFNGFRQLSGIDKERRNQYSTIVFVLAVVAVLNRSRLTKIYRNILRRTGVLRGGFNLAAFTTGRSSLATGYIIQWITNPIALIWGYGFQYVKHIGVAMNEYHSSNVSHNTFLDVILSWGMIGAFAVTYIVYKMVKRSFNQNLNYGFYDLIPVFCLIISFFALSCLSAGMFWYMVAAALLAVKHSKNVQLKDA